MDTLTDFVADPWAVATPERERVAVFSDGLDLYPAAEGGLFHSTTALPDSVGELLPVGCLGRDRLYVARASGVEGQSLRSVYPNASPAERAALGAARQRLQWVQDHAFCGRCGGPTQWYEHEYTLYCAHCDHRHYPRVSPCVIVAVHDGDWLLLGRSPRHPPDLWTLIAGFIEPGESAEAAVAREVQEETGVQLADVRYHGSESWPFPHQLMLGYSARFAGGPLRRAEDELVALEWFHRDSLPRVPGDWTIAGRLIQAFSQGRA
ncbi:NAD(+) diphosphatase [uncultured Halovibrio sp.]|mgnify:FL=1|uniref:NAD(+) diphosphatase n=1 Tax=uncultured Halovibrio sp. TaxID=985049 RepID=UPI0025E74601|nr:NAD(+) diphosphatase [uncultured Halovibrio sp.]